MNLLKNIVILGVILSTYSLFSQEINENRNYVFQQKVGQVTLINEPEEDSENPPDEITIPDTPAESRLWLEFFKKNNQLLNFENLIEWETINETAIMSNQGFLSSSNNPIDEELTVPQGNLGVDSIYNLDFADNTLRNVDFLISLSNVRGDLSFTNNQIQNLNGMYFIREIIGNAYFNNNNLNSISNLINLTTINGELTLYNNPQLKSLFGLRSFISGTIRLDEPSQYTRKAEFFSNFCQSFDDGAIEVYLAETNTRLLKSEVCESDPWLSFFQENNQLTAFEKISEWENENDFSTARIENSQINNFDLPNGKIGIESLYTLDFNNNELTTLSFMEGVNNIRGSLILNNNFIRDIQALNKITLIDGDLNLENNALRSLNGLENLEKIDRIFINNNPLSNLEEISNLFEVNDIYIDESSQYDKLDYQTPLCNSFINGVVDFIVQNTGISAEKSEICNGIPEFDDWLTFIQSKGQLEDFNTIFDWVTFDDFADLSNQQITNTEISILPETIGVYSIFGLDLSQNELKNINFLGSVREVRTNLYLQLNDLIFLSGLQQLESVNLLDISKNLRLNDIRGLSNINEAQRIIFDNPTQYEYKPNYNSDFCSSLIEGDIIATTVSGERLTAYELCSEIPSSQLWLLFLNKYNQLTEFEELEEWEDEQETVRVNANLEDQDIPNVSIPLNKIYDLYFNNNQLTNINFLEFISEIEEDLNLSNNNISNILGISNLTRVRNINLAENNLKNLEGFNVSELDSLDISENPALLDISNLENLEIVNEVIIDQATQYITKPNINSDFCQGVKSGEISVRRSRAERPVGVFEICQGEEGSSEAWLFYFQKNNQLTTLNDLEEWSTSEDSVIMRNLLLDSNNIPQFEFGVSEIGYLDFSENRFTSVKFLKNVEILRKDVNLSKNLITGIADLDKLRIVEGTLDLSSNSLGKNALSVGSNNIESLTTIEELKIYDNPFLESINALNIIEGNTVENPVIIRMDEPSIYETNYFRNRRGSSLNGTEIPTMPKMDYYTSFCTGLIERTIIGYISEGSTEINKAIICNGVPDNAAWLQFFQSYGNLESFELLTEWNTENETVTISNQSLTNEDLPDASMELGSIFELNMSNNNLTNVDFMAFIEGARSNIDFSNNNIESLRGLGKLRVVSGELKLFNNNYNSLEDISNLTLTPALRIDDPSSFPKLSYSKPLCKAIESGNVVVYIGEDNNALPLGNVCYTADNDPNTAWLQFFKNNNQLLTFDDLVNWESRNELADVSGLGLLNSTIPSGVMQLDSIHSLDFSNNNLDNAFFLSNIKTIRGDLNLSNNNLSNISAISRVERAGKIETQGNINVTSLLPAQNMTSVSEFIINDITQYTTKPEIETDFCQSVISLNVNVFDTNRKLSVKDVCNNATSSEEWLNFFQAEHNTLTTLSELSQWSFRNVSAQIIENQNITNNSLPTTNLSVSSLYELEITNQQIDNLNFLTDVTEIRSGLNFNNNVISDISGLLNVVGNIDKLLLSNNTITDISVLSGKTFSDLDLSNNQLVNLTGVDFTTINNLYLNNNLLTDISALNTLTTVEGVLSLENNTGIIDITGISNVSSGTINIDEITQYTIKPDFSTPLCQAILANDVTIIESTSGNEIFVEQICENVDAQGLWLSYFHKNEQLLELDNIDEWLTIDEEANLPTLLIENEDLPIGNIGVLSLFTLDFSDNNLSNVDFLSGLEGVRDNLLLNNNTLTSTIGLSELRDVFGILNLSNTNILNSESLINLRNVGTLDLSENNNLTNLSGLENIEFGSVILNDPTQYELIDFTSAFCFGVSRGEVVPYEFVSGRKLFITEICNGVPNDAKWLNYMQVNNQLLGFTDISDWELLDETATLSGQNLTVADIPSARMTTTSLYKLDFSNNQLGNISFLNLVENIREEINFENNAITNISGLGRLVNANIINLSGNLIDSLDRMEAIESVNIFNLSNNPELDDISALRNIQNTTELYLNNTAIQTIAPIENYSSLQILDLTDTPLTDISPLADLIVPVIRLQDPLQILTKPDFNSNFCQEFYAGNISVTFENKEVYLHDVCKNVPAHIAWLDFFNKENQLTVLSSFDEWETSNQNANLSTFNILGDRLPQQSFELNSIYGLDFSQNRLNDVDFLSGVTEVRNILGFENNLIENFEGMNDVQNITNKFDISDNLMTEFNPLNLLTVGEIVININSNLESIIFPQLTNIDSNLSIDYNPLLTSINYPMLEQVEGNFSIEGNEILDTIDINNIVFRSYVSIRDNNSLLTINQDNIDRIENDLVINNNNALSEVSINVNGLLGRDLQIANNDSLETISINIVPSLSRNLLIDNNPILTSILVEDIQNQNSGGVTISNNDLLTDLTINNMRYIRSTFNVQNNAALENVTLGTVERAYNQIIMDNMPALKTVNFGTIETASNQIRLYQNPLLESINIGSITTASSNVLANDNPELLSFISGGMTTINGILNLSNNPKLSTLELGLTDRINSHFYLSGNNALTDITGLSNISYINPSRAFALDDPVQYTKRVEYETPFCRGITASDIIPKFNNGWVSVVSLCNNTPNHALWMDIFHFYNQMRDANTIFDWELDANSSSVNISGQNLSENEMPPFAIDANKIYIFNISNNNYTQLDIMSNLTEIRHSFIANNNIINDISDLTNLTRVENVLDLSNNRLINVNGLGNLTYVGQELSLHTNNSLIDLSGLANIAYAPRVELDSPEQYLTILDAQTPFCQAIVTQDVKVYIGNTNEKIPLRFLCTDAEDQDLWLNLFHTYNQLLSFTELSTWETSNTTGDLSDKQLAEIDLPEEAINTTSIFTLLMNDNNISDVDFMSNVTTVRNTLNFANNQINTIAGLTNITNYQNLYLQNNGFSDVSPIDGILTGLTNIDLSFNDITRTPDLSNFSDLNNVYLNDNINLLDISGLANLRIVDKLYLNNTNLSNLSNLINLERANEVRLDDGVNYSPKLNYVDSFCQGIKNDIILTYFNSTRQDIRDLCQNFPDDYLWLLFFQDNNQITSYNDILEWETKNGIVEVSSQSLQNQDLPSGLLGITSLYTLDLNNNFIENLDFLTNLTTVRFELNLSDNALNDISGLSSLTTASRINLANNSNLGDISALNQLITIIDLDLSNTGRTSLIGLDSLTTVTGTLDLRNNPTLLDISLLNQFESIEELQIDAPEQYTKLVYADNIVCDRINQGLVKLYNNTNRLQANRICSEAPSEFDWLDFFKAFNQNTGFDNYYSLQQWNTTNTTADLNNLNLTNAELPIGDFGVDSIYSIQLHENALTDISFLNDVSEIRGTISLYSNQLTNVDPLISLTDINNGNIFLYDNLLTNVDGLINVTNFGNSAHQRESRLGTWQGRPGVSVYQINLRQNRLENVNGLINLETMTYSDLYLDQNPTLTDISGIANLRSVTFFSHRHCATLMLSSCNPYTQTHYHWVWLDNPEQYTVRPSIDSDFCTAVSNGTVRVQAEGSRLASSQVCAVQDEWLLFFHDYNQILWTLRAEDLGTANLIINLDDNNITNSDMPTVSMPVDNFYSIYLRNNQLTDVNFLNGIATVRWELYLDNNDLVNLEGMETVTTMANFSVTNNSNLISLKGLEGMQTFTRHSYFNNNPALTDITGLSNVTSTNNYYIYLDEPSQYTHKPLIDSPICQAGKNGTVRFSTDSRVLSYEEVCDASEAWLQFLQSNGQATGITELIELTNQTTPIDLSGRSITNSTIPDGVLSLDRLLDFNISNNGMSSVGFLVGLNTLSGDLNVSNNSLSDVLGFENLSNVDGNLLLNDNQLITLGTFENLSNVGGNFDISGNIGLFNLFGISNLSNVGSKLLVQDPVQYTIKPDVSTSFCNAVALDNIIVEIKDTAELIDVNKVCSTVEEWLSYLHSNDALVNNTDIEQWLTNSISVDLTNKNLVNADLPQVEIPVTNGIYNLDISGNNLEDVSFMTNIATVNILNISGNNTLLDISQLSTISSGLIYVDDYSQYTTKPDMDSDFCQAILNNTLEVRLVDETVLKLGNICDSTSEWLNFIQDNDQILDNAYITDMQTNDLVINISNNSLTDENTPNSIWGVNSVYEVNLQNNQLTNIDFLSGVENVRENIDASLNNLQDVNGMFSVTTAKDLFFNGNDLRDISGLINLVELTGYLYLSGNPNLTDISQLRNIQINNASFPIYIDDPSQYTTKPLSTSNFCLAVSSGNVTVINQSNGTILGSAQVCQ